MKNKLIAKPRRKPFLAGLVSFAFLLFVGLFILWQRYHIMQENRQREMSGIINIVEKNIDQSLKYSYSAALSLALQINEDGEIDNFDDIASQLVDSNPNIDAIEIVPGGVITQVYPYEENAEAIGYDILADSTRNKEALIAIESRKMFFAGPLKLKQGGTAIVGRLPVFIKNKFWGFSAVLMHFDNLIEQSGIETLSRGEYHFQFSKIDPDTKKEVILLNNQLNLNQSYSEEIILPDGNWKLYIVPDVPLQPLYTLLPLILLIFLLAGTFGYLVYSILKQPAILEARVKEQAGALAKSELRFRSIFNQATIGMARVDSNTGMILETNKRFQQLLGYTNVELRQMDYKMVSHPDDLYENTSLMHQLKENKIREYSLTKRLKRKDGSTIWIKLNVSPLWPEGEKATSHIALVQDISERIKAQQELEENEKRYRSLVENSNEIILIISKDGKLIYSSPSLKRITGYEEVDLSDNEILSLIHPSERIVLLKKLQRSKSSAGTPFSEIILRIRAKEGHWIWMNATLTNMLKEKNIGGYVVNLRDISGKKEAELNLMKSYDFVMEQNKRLLNFAYIVSHNLRSHSSNLESILELYETEDIPEEKDHYIALLKKVSKSLNETLYDLNEVVSINTNLEIRSEELEVSEYLDKALAVLSLQIDSMEAEIIKNIPSDMKVYFNPAYLESVLLNFITNALRYNHPDRKPKIILNGKKKNDKWILEICDNGIGIDLEKHGDKVFGLYKTFSGRKDSRGIGLFITRNQINAMGGKVKVESTPGEGTCFKVYF